MRQVVQVFAHPDFDTTTWSNDIAILKVDPFDPSIMADILTALESPEGETVCQAISSDPVSI